MLLSPVPRGWSKASQSEAICARWTYVGEPARTSEPQVPMRCLTLMHRARHPARNPGDFGAPTRLIPAWIGLTLTLVAVLVLLSAQTADAKVLPVLSISVVTPKPTAGSPTQVLVRFGGNFDLPDAPWENLEVSVVSADRTDASGWPLDRNYRGALVPLRRIGKGAYRGSVVVDRSGDYVVFAWSSVYAREARFQGVVTKFQYAAPVRFRMGSVERTAHGVIRSSSGRRSSTVLVAILLLVSLFMIGACVALLTARARSRRRVAGARR